MNASPPELRSSYLAPAIRAAAGIQRFRGLCVRAALRLEGGHFYSHTARDLLKRYFGVEIGAYSYGHCFRPGAFPTGVRIGRYVSIAPGVSVFLRHHPLDRLPMHPFFYNCALEYVSQDTIQSHTLEILHEAWIGHNAIITSQCRRIGIGAVVAAGAVVTKNVDDFAVVGGNPARLIKYRFSLPIRLAILDSQWWKLPPYALAKYLPDILSPLDAVGLRHPLLSRAITRAPDLRSPAQPTSSGVIT